MGTGEVLGLNFGRVMYELCTNGKSGVYADGTGIKVVVYCRNSPYPQERFVFRAAEVLPEVSRPRVSIDYGPLFISDGIESAG